LTTGEPRDSDIAAIGDARDQVLERIAAASRRVGRDAAEVMLVAVTKTVPVDRVRAAVAAGLTTLGENRVQEGEAKRPSVDGAVWHLIGPLQSNKARRAMGVFDTIESVDSVELAQRLGRIRSEAGDETPVPVLLQVNVDQDPGKAGFAPDGLERALDGILSLEGLAVRGLMTVGRLVETSAAARPTFVALRRLSERLRDRHPELGPELSMGMSDDFEVAIEEGSTIIRVGRALFGEREPHRAG
jgi:PLP dependent protein